MLRVRIRPECPKGNQRELIWASKPDYGRAITGKALRHRQARAQNKGRNRLAGCRPSPSGDRQPEPEGGNRGRREALSTKL